MFTKAFNESGSSPAVMLRIIVSLYDNHYVSSCYKMFKKLFQIVDDDFNDGYSYMALCCWELRKDREFIHYLEEGVARNPNEAKTVLGHLFPDETKPEEYVGYMRKKLNQ